MVNDALGVSLWSLTGSMEVHVLTRGGLSHMQPETVAQLLVTVDVMRQESAEAIVGAGRRQRQTGGWK